MSDCTSIIIDTSDKSTGVNELFTEFAKALKNIGIFPREYDIDNLEKLFYASEAVHGHLCKLDTGYYNNAREVKLVELANAYAKCSTALKQLE